MFFFHTPPSSEIFLPPKYYQNGDLRRPKSEHFIKLQPNPQLRKRRSYTFKRAKLLEELQSSSPAELSFSPPTTTDDLADSTTHVRVPTRRRMERTVVFKHPNDKISKQNCHSQPTTTFCITKIETCYKCDTPISNLTKSLREDYKRTQMQLQVFVPLKQGGVHKLYLSVDQRTSGLELIKTALEKVRKVVNQSSNKSRQQKKYMYLPLYSNPHAYQLRVAEDDGNADSDWPPLDKSAPVYKLGCTVFVLVPKKDYDHRRKNVLSSNDSIIRHELSSRDVFLDDIWLKVYLPNRVICTISISPDVVWGQLLKTLAKRFKLDPKAHTLLVNVHDQQMRLSESFQLRTLRTLNINEVAIVRTVEEDDSGWVFLKPEEEEDDDILIPNQPEIGYTQYHVIKVNKYHVRQERILGIDAETIYNKKPEGATFLGIRSRTVTKHPERSIDTLLEIKVTGDKNFSLRFSDGETLYYETRTKIEADEIINKLQYLMRLRKYKKKLEEKKLLGKRKSSILLKNATPRNSAQLRQSKILGLYNKIVMTT